MTVVVRPPSDIDAWILAGQSNMEGVGELSDALPSDERVWSFTSAGRWEQAREPLHRFWESFTPVHQMLCRRNLAQARQQLSDGELAELELRERTHGAGLGLAFAHDMLQATGRPIGLLPCAHGGTSLAQWSPEQRHRGGDSLYGALCARVERAGVRPRGILWYQGESEGWDLAAATTYGQDFATFVSRIRSDLGDPELPVLVVQIGCTMLDTPQAAAWNLVQRAQAGLPGSIPGTEVTSAIDLPLVDAIHINANGLKRLGQRLARLALGQRGPRLIAAHRGSEPPDRGLVTLDFADVTGGWQPADHIAGFEVLTGTGQVHAVNHVINAFRDRVDPARLRIRLNLPLADGDRLVYGHGLRPYCNAVDAAGMPLLAGEIPIER